jgi:hypothetical protein
MPARVMDYEALWRSDKIASCAQLTTRLMYAWSYGIADANGSFELSNLRSVWRKVCANLPEVTFEEFSTHFTAFQTLGLMFTWEVGGKKYGHWTQSEKPGRLPKPSHRKRYTRFAPPVPRKKLKTYMEKFSFSNIPQHSRSRGEGVPSDSRRERDNVPPQAGATPADAGAHPPKDKDLDLDLDKEKVKQDSNPPRAAHAARKDGRFTSCVKYVYENFTVRRGQAPTWFKKDFAQLALLLKKRTDLPIEEFVRRWDCYGMSLDPFVVKQGISLGYFCANFDKFLAGPAPHIGGASPDESPNAAAAAQEQHLRIENLRPKPVEAKS